MLIGTGYGVQPRRRNGRASSPTTVHSSRESSFLYVAPCFRFPFRGMDLTLLLVMDSRLV
jgi:hypothetical protein